MTNNDLPMKEILSGLMTMIELKMKEDISEDTKVVLADVNKELDEIANTQWRVEGLTELNVRFEKLTEKLNKVKDNHVGNQE